MIQFSSNSVSQSVIDRSLCSQYGKKAKANLYVGTPVGVQKDFCHFMPVVDDHHVENGHKPFGVRVEIVQIVQVLNIFISG